MSEGMPEGLTATRFGKGYQVHLARTFASIGEATLFANMFINAVKRIGAEEAGRDASAITWQRELLLDLANKLKINLKDLDGATAEDEWEALGQAIRDKMQDLDVGS